MRFVTPLFFAAAGAWVHVYNGDHAGRVMVLPFMDAFASDPAGQGRATVVTLFVFAGTFAVWDTIRWISSRKETRED